MDSYSVIDAENNEIHTDVCLHPGEIICMELEARGIMKANFARQLGLSPSHFSELLHAKRNINASIAVQLEILLGIPAEYWMRVQVSYDLFIERNKRRMAA